MADDLPRLVIMVVAGDMKPIRQEITTVKNDLHDANITEVSSDDRVSTLKPLVSR